MSAKPICRQQVTVSNGNMVITSVNIALSATSSTVRAAFTVISPSSTDAGKFAPTCRLPRHVARHLAAAQHRAVQLAQPGRDRHHGEPRQSAESDQRRVPLRDESAVQPSIPLERADDGPIRPTGQLPQRASTCTPWNGTPRSCDSSSTTCHWYTIYDADVGGFLGQQSAPMWTMLNTAVGGDFLGDQQPDGTTVWPQQFLIDYVRVFESNDAPLQLSERQL